MKNIVLYEWQKIDIPHSTELAGLNEFLDTVWKTQYNIEKQTKQKLLTIENHQIKAYNFVGFLFFENTCIEIYPKIFAQKTQPNLEEKQNMIANMMYWLSYSRKIKFPFGKIPFESHTTDNILDAYIYLFAKQSCKIITNQQYQSYEKIKRESSFVKGKIRFSDYFSHFLSKGKAHIIPTTFQAFEYDNRFNQLVKFTAKNLLALTKHKESKALLEEILFIFSEISDNVFVAEDCKKISMGRMYDTYQEILNMCHFFLSMQVFSGTENSNHYFCFLLPMEVVFEDFVSHIIKKEGKKKGFPVVLQAQKYIKYLANESLFRLKPDILLPQKRIIDAKYKALSSEKRQNYQINPQDLYQMLAYATRFGIKDIVLVYPKFRNEKNIENLVFEIENNISTQKEIVTIRIVRVQIDFIAENEKENIINNVLNVLIYHTIQSK